jgi:hypothetical protein
LQEVRGKKCRVVGVIGGVSWEEARWVIERRQRTKAGRSGGCLFALVRCIVRE